MASLFVFGGILAYEKYKDRKTRKQASKERFAQLERENADRIAALQEKTCFYNTSDWTGQGCAVHGPEAQRQMQGRERGQMEEKRRSEEFERTRDVNTTSTLLLDESAPAYSDPITNNNTHMEITTSMDNASAHSAPVIYANATIESLRTSEASTRNEETTMPSEERATRTGKSRNEPSRRRRNRRGSESEDEEELIIPDVSHVVPPRYEDVRTGRDGGVCKRTLKQKVLRRQGECAGGREVVR
ncbi:MAG: hypothetical protein Q9179_003077 [Wetmoreana sp. 5 TL-2023]